MSTFLSLIRENFQAPAVIEPLYPAPKFILLNCILREETSCRCISPSSLS